MKHPSARWDRTDVWRKVAVVLLMAIAGCAKNENLSEVTGLVTLDGKPLVDAMIVFSPTVAGTTSYGRTDSEGKYRMQFRDDEYGAWVGENVVRITTFDLGTGDHSGKKEQVPSIYNSKSATKVTVAAGTNTHNFELKSDAGRIVQGPKE